MFIKKAICVIFFCLNKLSFKWGLQAVIFFKHSQQQFSQNATWVTIKTLCGMWRNSLSPACTSVEPVLQNTGCVRLGLVLAYRESVKKIIKKRGEKTRDW